MAQYRHIAMKPMSPIRHLFAYVTLFLLCGFYYIIMVVYPLLLILTVRGSIFAGIVFATLLTLQFMPLKYEGWDALKYSYLFFAWKEYFDFTSDISNFKFDKDKKYMFFEFPHGVFPMGQLVSTCVVKDITPGKLVCGTGADAVFTFPFMRQFMAWIGTRPANRKNISKIFKDGHNVAIIPGGIAEMYLISEKQDEVYFRKRLGTVKAAIQEGAIIVPVYFFGNTRLFEVGGSNGSESFIAKLSRKLKASIMFFYGRHYLPVPYRHPIKMVFAKPVDTAKFYSAEPTDAQLQEVSDLVAKSLQEMYQSDLKPEWEDRPLVIS